MSVTLACVGVVVLDEVFRVDALPCGDGKYFARDLLERGGGMAATAAVAAARLGGAVSFHGRVGDDEAGRRLLAALAAHDVDAGGCRVCAGARTGRSAVMLGPGGERMIVVHADRRLDPDASWLPLERILGARAVLADIRWLDGARAVLAAMRAKGGIAVLDADVTDEAGAAEALAAATHIVFSDAGLRRLAADDDTGRALRAVAERTGAAVAVTLGSRGCCWLDSGRLRRLPAVQVGARDTLGAGDVFHGAFALGLAEGMGMDAALRFATAAAGAKCMRSDGWDGMPARDEVEAMMRGLEVQP
ncbi:MAG: sugar kinase [Rhodospirillaceae bacterium]|nr:sugar kinase [Rhodospirillaceae bacterium]